MSQSFGNVVGSFGESLADVLRSCRDDGRYGDDLDNMAAARMYQICPTGRAARWVSSYK